MSPGSTLLFGAIPKQLSVSREEKRALGAFARKLSERLAGGRGFGCLLTNDAELRRLNLTFLGHDYPTDVLSFPDPNSLGEIAISVERAEAQAQEFGHARIDEIRILMLHGVLHLAGMDHEEDSGEMLRAEAYWRAEFALPETLIARSETAAAR